MVQKNFGPAVSGYLDPEGRAFEQAVYQSGKAFLDREFNLSDELATNASVALTRSLSPSGWVTDSPLTTSQSTTAIFVNSATPNLLVLEGVKAVVNGWGINVSYTLNNGTRNHIDLGAAPAGTATKRTDLVILEVWRKLISSSPDTDGKSTGGRIWRNGNVKIPPANDAALNYADDLLDVVIATETTKRVQIQYRLRVVQGVDLFSYPSGLDDPSIVARTVPPNASTPDGSATSYTYANQSVNGDAGLWLAGDGNPANALATVDGYMYAIPLVAVFRRNSTAWTRIDNHNGGSGRPDGFTHDIIEVQDLADIRRAVMPGGWTSYQEIGEKNFGYLLDNVVKTEWGTTGNGGGVHGHTLFTADEIGVLPGSPPLTGDTAGAEFLGQFDATRRFFSDRSTYEVMTVMVAPGGAEVSTATWQTGTVITLPLASIAQYPYPTSIGFLTRAPTGTRVIDVGRAWIAGTAIGQKSVELGMTFAVAPSTTPDSWPVESLTGIGEYPTIASNIVITLGTVPVVGLTTEPAYIDLVVAYPSGMGLSKTPVRDFGPASFEFNVSGVGTAPESYSGVGTHDIDAVHREAQLQYLTSTLTYTLTVNSTASASKHLLPERVQTLVAVRKNTVAVFGSTLDSAGRVLTLTAPAASGDVIDVDYVAVRPYYVGHQLTVYYEARAAQAIRSALLGASATLVPRWISPHLYCITSGSGSQGESYPYPSAYVQTGGVIKDGGSWAGEHELDGSVDIFVSDFNSATGFVKVPAYIPYAPSSEEVTFTRSPGDTDIEGRSFFPTVPTSVYVPNAFGQNLSNERVHKVVLPLLMEATEDTTFGTRGTLFLVLFTRWAAFDAENSVKFLTSSNSTTASVFRVAGNLTNRRS
jgi:hypothetical protein